jgi:hypothetical protein
MSGTLDKNMEAYNGNRPVALSVMMMVMSYWKRRPSVLVASIHLQVTYQEEWNGVRMYHTFWKYKGLGEGNQLEPDVNQMIILYRVGGTC